MPRSRAPLGALPLLLLAACAGASARTSATAASPAASAAPAARPIPAATRQLLVVRTPDWDDIHGTLQRFTRRGPGAAWTAVGAAEPIVVGRTGLAWGRGLHGEGVARGFEGPVKREGDGKSPAGAYTLSRIFGYAPPDSMRDLRMPYVQATEDLRCVDDAASPAYNALVRAPAGAPEPWASAEHMRLASGAYRIGVFVDHNAGAQRAPGGGSCIFLHVWSGPDSPTVGCTAMPLERMAAIARWLDPAAQPVLVQLPDAAYGRLRAVWALP
ncbi:MAG TPA: L,D-transpeptidase family protein [Gemmatimonadales bacterium]|nr:L,D-transpeptidase family protein [Gemmatimonadales bacterium]